MAKCRVVKGGWFWLGEMQHAGAVIEGVSPEWIANRAADGGLVEPLAAAPVIEQAVHEPEAEAAVSPRQRKTKK